MGKSYQGGKVPGTYIYLKNAGLAATTTTTIVSDVTTSKNLFASKALAKNLRFAVYCYFSCFIRPNFQNYLRIFSQIEKK